MTSGLPVFWSNFSEAVKLGKKDKIPLQFKPFNQEDNFVAFEFVYSRKQGRYITIYINENPFAVIKVCITFSTWFSDICSGKNFSITATWANSGSARSARPCSENIAALSFRCLTSFCNNFISQSSNWKRINYIYFNKIKIS